MEGIPNKLKNLKKKGYDLTKLKHPKLYDLDSALPMQYFFNKGKYLYKRYA